MGPTVNSKAPSSKVTAPKAATSAKKDGKPAVSPKPLKIATGTPSKASSTKKQTQAKAGAPKATTAVTATTPKKESPSPKPATLKAESSSSTSTCQQPILRELSPRDSFITSTTEVITSPLKNICSGSSVQTCCSEEMYKGIAHLWNKEVTDSDY